MKQTMGIFEKSLQMKSDGDNSGGSNDPQNPSTKEEKSSGVIKPVPAPQKNPKMNPEKS